MSENKMQKWRVVYEFTGHYTAEVMATSLDEAMLKSQVAYDNANFGEVNVVENYGKIYAENEDGQVFDL